MTCRVLPQQEVYIRFGTLFCVAYAAYYLRNKKSINGVVGVVLCMNFVVHACPSSWHGRASCGTPRSFLGNQQGRQNRTIVVTDAAAKGSPAAGCYQSTVSNIMVAARTGEFGTLCLFVGNRYANCRVIARPIRFVASVPVSIWTGIAVPIHIRVVARLGTHRSCSAGAAPPSVHETLNRPTSFLRSNGIICQNRLDTSPSFFLFFLRHDPTSILHNTIVIAECLGHLSPSFYLEFYVSSTFHGVVLWLVDHFENKYFLWLFVAR